MKRQGIILAAFLAVQLLVAITLGTSVTYALENGKAPQGLRALDVDLAGLTRDEAWHKIESQLLQTLEFGEQRFPLRLDQTKHLWREWLDGLYQHSSGSRLMDALTLLERLGKNVSAAPPRFSEAEVLPQLKKIKATLDRPPVPARVAFQGGQFTRQKGQAGQVMDIKGTWEALLQGQGAKAIKMNPVVVNPGDADLDKIKDTLGDYTTYFDSRDQFRTINVRLAAKALDGQLLAPGDVFSFNKVVGERTEPAGYLPAYVFVNKDIVKADGGGVCQDSSTLYQAVKQAHLEITERHSHSLPVAYVPRGQDATVSFGQLDFGFRNNTQGYILLSARSGENWVRIRLFGMADADHPVLSEPGGYPEHPKDWNGEYSESK